MKRFILTGAPGSGKTSILHALRDRGYPVIAEAATEVIALEQAQGNDQPWNEPQFADKIVELQRSRQRQPVAAGTSVQIYDRSPVCTLALAHYLAYPVSDSVAGEVDRIVRERVYERQVFFIQPIGFIEPTAARRITQQESLKFERCHRDEYVRLGFELVEIPPGKIEERAALIDAYISSEEVEVGTVVVPQEHDNPADDA